MRINRKTFFLSLMVIVSMLAVEMRPAEAQTDDTYFVKASRTTRYARYYAPYAIQAAAAYLPVSEFNLKYLKTDENKYGADVNYAVQGVFGGDSTYVAPAREAIKSWQYQFGSDSYLTCFDSADPDCQNALRNRGWDFGSGPAFQVWARKRFPQANSDICSEISIAFRGTVGWSGGDWYSNANRFGSPYDDYYHQLRRNIDGIMSSIKRLRCYRLATQIVSTGHSLGGGLAQFVALANKNSPRIRKVFAFDPSPVTGAHLVEKQLLTANTKGLTIDRIYQEGEVLSYARSIPYVQEFPASSSRCRPYVRTVKVDAVASGNAVGLHGVRPLAMELVRLYSEDKLAYTTPPVPVSEVCALRYRAPATDEDGDLVASAGAPRTLVASARNRRQQVNQLAEAQRSDSVTDMSPSRIDSMAMIPDERRSKKIRVAGF